MRSLLTIATLLFFVLGHAQDDRWQRIVQQKVPLDLRMSAKLYQLGTYALTDPDAAIAMARSWDYPVRKDGWVYVELISVNGEDIDIGPARSAGMEATSVWRDRASAWVDLRRLIPIVRQLSSEYLFQSADLMSTNNEGPALMNSGTYIAGGADGSNIKIAVIDAGFDTLTEAGAAGVAPSIFITYDHTGTGLQTGDIHGTGCAETIYDHAPGATYYMHKVASTADLGDAVSDAINDNVQIISMSLSYFNTGWSDDEGPACAAINSAAQNGILCFVSAGNRADQEHWQGPWSDGDSNDILNWGGGSEMNFATVPGNDKIELSLQWAAGPDPFSDDYDLFLWDASTNNQLTSSQSAFTFESLTWVNPSSTPRSVFISVRNDGTDVNDLELFSRDDEKLSIFTAASSTTSPSNCTHPNVLCIGAVEQSNYASPAGTSGINAIYSGQGPSNTGMILPDLVGPTSTTTFAYGGPFGGTSCATPNAAGAAAAFWSANPSLNADGVRLVLTRMAGLYRDWGTAESDNLYGAGGVFLKTFTPNTQYILEGSGNTNGTPTLPYSSMQQADQFAPQNSNAFFLGGTYNAPPVNTILNTPMIYRSVVEGAIVE